MPEQEIHTVIAIDDHPLFRKGVSDLIDMDDSLSLIGEAANGKDGLELVREHNPDLVLLDINMKGMDGLETLEAIKKLDLDSRVLMLTVSDNDEDVIHALRIGADGYLLKDMEPEDTLKCLNKAAQGQMVISERLTQLLAQALRGEKSVKKS
ncbi:MAG: response regulator, partial [Sedimenticola sp.]